MFAEEGEKEERGGIFLSFLFCGHTEMNGWVVRWEWDDEEEDYDDKDNDNDW